MYRVYADDTLIYDSELEDYKINKGSISLEVNKSGSFSFSIYPDHFYYDKFVKMKTIIKVTRTDEIIFRGRILNDTTDYFNNKVITCEGELGFFNDSIIRPFSFQGSPENLFRKFIEEHNSQVDDFKKFKIGACTVIDPNNYIIRENSAYETALSNMSSRLTNGLLGGYFVITHENNDDTPTINYLADYSMKDSQVVEFGSNLKNYTKTVKAENMMTAIIPLGATLDDESEKRLTIESVNEGKDYICDEQAVNDYGFILKTVEWDDVTEAENLLKKAKDYLDNVINQDITIELTAIDLHLLNKNIKAFSLGDYIKVISAPHKVNTTMMCSKQTVDLLNPDNDSIILGATLSTLSGNNASSEASFIDKQNKNYINMLNRLSSKSGFYSSYEEDSTGGRIQYIHDKPDRSVSSIIWRMTAESVQVSTDGGLSYTAGITCDGDALYKTIVAKGISADIIRTGTLTIGGSDTDSAQLQILNKYNEICLTANENGVKILNGEINATSGTLENMTILNGIYISNGNSVRTLCNYSLSDGGASDETYCITIGCNDGHGGTSTEIEGASVSINSYYGTTIIGDMLSIESPTEISNSLYVSSGIKSPTTSNFGQLYVDGWLWLTHPTAYGTQKGNLYRNSNGKITVSTSSKRYKENITSELEDFLNPEKLYDLPVVQFNYNEENKSCDVIGGTQIGLIAEDVSEFYPNACVYNDDGKPENWYERTLIPAILKLVQNQKRQIDILEEKIKIVEGKLKDENN